MGEVYRPRNTKRDRDVTLKVVVRTFIDNFGTGS